MKTAVCTISIVTFFAVSSEHFGTGDKLTQIRGRLQ
jgi:hypothetical protein